MNTRINHDNGETLLTTF